MKAKSIYVCAIVGMVVCIAAPMMFASANATQQAVQGADAQLAAQNAAPQTGSASPDDPKFVAFVYDIASIKPHKEDPYAAMSFSSSHETPDGYSGTNTTLRGMVGAAYHTDHSQIGDTAPQWLGDEKYDLEAKMDPAVAEALLKLSPEDRRLARRHMIQALLQDRLKLAVHLETKEVPVYDLVIAKNGAKVKETTDPNSPHSTSVHGAEGGMVMEGHGVLVANLVNQLSLAMHRPVFDKTGLTGIYDFTVKFAPDRGMPAADSAPAPEPLLPSIATAVEEQLGLKLVSAKGNMDIIVIDHVERPSGN